MFRYDSKNQGVFRPKKEWKRKMDNRPEVSVLAEQVKYQDQSVVSKTLIKKPNGSVTFFAFDQGQELSEHTTPYDALVCVLDGEVEIRISGNPYRLEAGEMIVLPANEPHALKAISKYKMMLTMIR